MAGCDCGFQDDGATWAAKLDGGFEARRIAGGIDDKIEGFGKML